MVWWRRRWWRRRRQRESGCKKEGSAASPQPHSGLEAPSILSGLAKAVFNETGVREATVLRAPCKSYGRLMQRTAIGLPIHGGPAPVLKFVAPATPDKLLKTAFKILKEPGMKDVNEITTYLRHPLTNPCQQPTIEPYKARCRAHRLDILNLQPRPAPLPTPPRDSYHFAVSLRVAPALFFQLSERYAVEPVELDYPAVARIGTRHFCVLRPAGHPSETVVACETDLLDPLVLRPLLAVHGRQ